MVLAAEGLLAWAHLRQDRYVGMEDHRQQFLIEWIRFMSDHNWRLLEHKAPTGLLGSSDPVSAIDVVAFQHLNLLLFFWTHKEDFAGEGLEAGLKRWVGLLVAGAKQSPEFQAKYGSILANRDNVPGWFLGVGKKPWA